MGPRSPTMTFEPTPALEENKENLWSFNDYHGDQHRSSSRGVHFSDLPETDLQVRRAQSIATTTVPLLQSVSSASQLPKHHRMDQATAPNVDINAYFEHSRSLLETLRSNHDRDKIAFDEEKKLWNTERSVLKARIADLEFKLNKSSNNSKRRYSNGEATDPSTQFRSDFASFSGFTPRTISAPNTNGAPPVWEGPKSTTPVTRVFSNDSDQGAIPNHLASISEDEAVAFPELTQEISPTTNPTAAARSACIPIDKIDSSLDGITLRSTALAPSFVARVMTPTQMASPARSPSPNAKQAQSQQQSHTYPPMGATTNGNLSLNINGLLSPMDEKLKRHAGHTPMAFGGPAAFSSTAVSTEVPTPREEKPVAPAPTTRPPLRPSEDSDTYFSYVGETRDQQQTSETVAEEAIETGNETSETWQTDIDNDSDPGLRGPLMLDSKNKSNSSNEFLDQVDAKLMEASAARKDSVLSNSTNADAESSAQVLLDKVVDADSGKKEEVGSVEAEKDFEMPKLRMKKSTNFGSAFGSNQPGSKW